MRIICGCALTLVALALLNARSFAQFRPEQAQSTEPVRCEFRVFNGSDEVTRETQVRLYTSGKKEGGTETQPGGLIELKPGIYDARAIREENGRVISIRWMEHLVVMPYPDEGGHHLEVLNFKPQYGALEVKTPTGTTDFQATAFPAGNRTVPSASGIAGPGYVLLVVPAGRYDVQIKPSKANERWLTDIDVPADRTRLKTLEPSKQEME